MPHQIPILPQTPHQPRVRPPQVLIQQQMRIRKHARVKQARLPGAEKVPIFAQQGRERGEGGVGFSVEGVRVDGRGGFEEFGLGGGAELV